MSARRLRAAGLLCALTASALLAGCDDTGPAAPVPATPDRPATLSPSSYLLRADQMPGYTRSNSQTLSSGSLGDEAADPALKGTLDGQGFQYGARYTYVEPQNVTTLPFAEVVTQAMFFNDAAGAARFFADEAVRHNVPPSNGGSVHRVDDMARVNVDDVTGFSAQAPGPVNDNVPPQSWLAVARRGRIVVELLGAGFQVQATRQEFDALLAKQEALLAVPPGG